MLSASFNGGRCIYCAFRTQQRFLQARRLGRSQHHLLSTTSAPRFRIRYGSNDRDVAAEKWRKAKERDAGARNFTSSPSSPRKVSRQKAPPASSRGRVRYEGIGRAGRVSEKAFQTALKNRVDVAKGELKNAPLLEQMRKEKEAVGQKMESFDKMWQSFTSYIEPTANQEDSMPVPMPFKGTMTKNGNVREDLLRDLRTTFSIRGQHGLDDKIKYAFYGHLVGSRFTSSDVKSQQALADLRYPSEWFPATRSEPRVIHLHVGPTNSGKTYHALQRLEKAESGVYGGPLRLLAHEVYSRMNAKGRPCSLVTGEEKRMASREQGVRGNLYACTVEMIPTNTSVDVAVIDEIQMIGSLDRGWAWTQALLGVKAKEVHLCGEARSIPLIREICASVGEELQVHEYERLTPLQMADQSLGGDLKNLRKGDCIVSFSVVGIHALRRQIEQRTGKNVATVYGSLPPETRAQQARLFNDPNNDFDFLVASDAVGMGLNLAIKRMIFESSSKYNGTTQAPLAVADVKQIAGRAGRYRIAGQESQTNVASENLDAANVDDVPAAVAPQEPVKARASGTENLGLVTTLEKFDHPFIRTALSSEPEPLSSAGLFPPSNVLQRFSSYFPPLTPFSYILMRLHELSQMHPRFHLCGVQDQVWIADLIEPVRGLTIDDRNIITSCPASKSDIQLWQELMPAFARAVAEQRGGALVDIQELPLELLDTPIDGSRDCLKQLERLHKGLVAYLWLSYRFAGIFNTRTVAFHAKGLVEEKIEEVLSKFSFTESRRKKLARQREHLMMKNMMDGLDGESEEAQEGGKEDSEGQPNGLGGSDERGAETEEEKRMRIQQQTSLAFGGDKFGGEEEMAFEDPVEAQHLDDQDPGSSAQLRTREQAKPQTPLSDAATEGEEEGLATAQRGQLLNQHPTLSESIPGETAEQISPASSEAQSLEQDPSRIERPVTPETEAQTPPMETQEVESRGEGEGEASRPGGFKQFEAGVPPKHLAHLDVDATEAERDVASRP